MINRLTLIGVGLIGGSLARALRRAGQVGEVVGCGRDVAQLERGVALGVIDRYTLEPAAAVVDADMVVLAVPLGAMAEVMREMAPGLRSDAIITDVGSAKTCVIDAARAVFGRVPPRLVPGHPIAGTEQSGVEASFAELFEQRRVILTPLPDTDPAALEQVRAMWQAAGAEVIVMDAAHHDAVLAATSHLPHVLAYALVDALLRMDAREEIFRYAAGGFRDFTRIAGSNPVMWRDICLANRVALLATLESFSGDLQRLTAMVRDGDGDGLLEVFTRAKQARDRYALLTPPPTPSKSS